MTSLIAPRYELPLLDPGTGQMSREWYKFFVQLAKSIGPSGTNTDDFRILESSLPTDAAQPPKAASESDLFGSPDLPQPPDVELLAWWPGAQS